MKQYDHSVKTEYERDSAIKNVRRLVTAEKRTPLAFLHTYGCQQNVADSERIRGLLREMGYGFTEQVQQADLILFNTCAVREHAELKVYGNVGALKSLKAARPEMLIILCGCMMQQESVQKQIREKIPPCRYCFRAVFDSHSCR